MSNSTVNFTDLNNESSTDTNNENVNTTSTSHTINTPNTQRRLIEETQDIGGSTEHVNNTSNSTNTQTSGNTKSSVGDRSPSYYSSVMNNHHFNTNDQNVYVTSDNVEHIEKLYQYLKNLNRGLKINSKNISMIIIRAVEIVNTWQQINFDEKDEVIIQALLVLVKEANLPEEEIYYLESSIKTVIEMIFKSIKGDVVSKKNKREQKARRRVNRYVKDHENERISTGQILETIVDKLTIIFKKGKYQSTVIIADLSVVVGMVINFVEQYSYLSGIEKKEVVVQSISIFLKERLPSFVNVDTRMKKVIDVSIEGLPQLVDLLVSVSNGKFEITMENISKCCIKLLPFLKGLGICKN